MWSHDMNPRHVLSSDSEVETFSQLLCEMEGLLRTFDSSHRFIQDCTGRKLNEVLVRLESVNVMTRSHTDNIRTLLGE